VLQARHRVKPGGGATVKEHAMSQKLNSAIAVIGIDHPWRLGAQCAPIARARHCYSCGSWSPLGDRV